MLLFLHPRQAANSSTFDSPSSLFPSSTPSTQSPFDTPSPLSTSFDSESRTDTDTSTPTTSFSFTPTSTTQATTSASTIGTHASLTSTSFSFDTSSSVPSSSFTASSTLTPPPSSSSPTPPVSSTPPSSSTLLTSFVTDINGVPTTIVTPVVTALHGSSQSRASSRPAIIAGSAIGGLVLFFIGLSAIFLLRRRVRRRRYWSLSRKRLPSRSTFLAGESMDLPQPTSPYSYADNDDPFATHSTSRHPSGDSGGSPPSSYPYAYSRRPDSPPHARTDSPVPSSPPRLFRARASESGSIFQESVWPPPSAASQLTDPLTSPSHAVDLGSIVNDVMGPVAAASEESGGIGRAREREGSGTSETGPLLGPIAGDQSPEPDLPTLSLTNPDPGSPLSPLQPPHTPPRPPQWLSRSPNPSPKNSPLHRTHPL